MVGRINVLILTASAFLALGPFVSLAQEPGAQRDAQPRQENPTQSQSEAAREGRANDRNGNDPNLNDDQSPRKDDGHVSSDRVADLRLKHPHAVARCHDGYFTTTRERGRACTRHGGIDIWLNE